MYRARSALYASTSYVEGAVLLSPKGLLVVALSIGGEGVYRALCALCTVSSPMVGGHYSSASRYSSAFCSKGR